MWWLVGDLDAETLASHSLTSTTTSPLPATPACYTISVKLCTTIPLHFWSHGLAVKTPFSSTLIVTESTTVTPIVARLRAGCSRSVQGHGEPECVLKESLSYRPQRCPRCPSTRKSASAPESSGFLYVVSPSISDRPEVYVRRDVSPYQAVSAKVLQLHFPQATHADQGHRRRTSP